MSKQQQVEAVIRELRQALTDVSGVIVATPDGLVLGADISESDPARGAAMLATASGLGKRITETLNLGTAQELVIKGDRGYIAVYRAADKAVLGVLARADANLGLINLEARSAVGRLASIL
jgi:hypothetical protein